MPAEMPVEMPVTMPAKIPRKMPVTTPAEMPVKKPVTMPAKIPAEMPVTIPVKKPVTMPVTMPITMPVKMSVKMMLPIFWLLTTLLSDVCLGYITTRMRIDGIQGCENIQVPQQNAIFEISAGTILSCGARCLNNDKCNSFDFDSNNGDCVGTDVGGADKGNNCLNITSNPGILHFEKFCLNNGYLSTLETCQCVDGWVGIRCERLQKNCREGFLDQGYKKNVYWVEPSLTPSPFRVKCTMDGNWYFMKRAGNPSVLNFNRSWDEYKNGFGDPQGDFWLGLDNIYYLSNDGVTYQLFTNLWLKNGTFLRSRQVNFKIGDESTKYQMTFQNSVIYSMDTLGDCFDDIKGQPFTTYDQDNDNAVGTNCAQLHGGGFWFDDCAPCNPTGHAIYPPLGVLSGDPSEWSWTKHLGNIAPFKIQFMMYWTG